MAETKDKLPAIRKVAFRFGEVDVTADGDRLINLTEMHKASGASENRNPYEWSRKEGSGFIEDLARNLNTPKNRIWKSKRGKHLGGTWAHWQVALAYAKYLSHEFHRFVNEAFREWAEEKADPGLKIERGLRAFEKAGKTQEWIERRFHGIGTRNTLTGTMADHNCKVNGPNDNPYAEATRSIALSVTGQTPKEFKESRGLHANAITRNHYDSEQLVLTDAAELLATRLIKTDSADGNKPCVECCRRAGAAIKLALDSLLPNRV